jgi:hypothetical protein
LLHMISTSLNQTNNVNIADKKNKSNLTEPLYIYFVKTPYEINLSKSKVLYIVSSGSIIFIVCSSYLEERMTINRSARLISEEYVLIISSTLTIIFTYSRNDQLNSSSHVNKNLNILYIEKVFLYCVNSLST